MKSFATFALFGVYATTVSAFEEQQLRYVEHLGRFGIIYDDITEFQERLEIFKKNDAFINEHNARSGENYRVRHNQFSDWRPDEY